MSGPGVGAGDLLARLGAVVRPDGARGREPRAHGVSSADFASLLDRAVEGTMGSGRRVGVEGDSGVSLTPAQLERVSKAADRAELAGIARAMVEIDGMSLLVDVPMRRVMGEAVPDAHGVVSGIDGVVRVDAQGGTSVAGREGLMRGGMNSTLLDELAKRDQRQAG